MSNLITEPGVVDRTHSIGLKAFRVVLVFLALLLLVLFGAWQWLLAPWAVLGDATDHGWARTPAAHRWSDSASGILMATLGFAALLLARSPRDRSGLVAWLAGCLLVLAGASTASVMIQQHAGPIGALLQGLAMAVLLGGLLVSLAPDRAAVVRGGGPGDAAPRGAVRMALLLGLGLAVTVVVLALVWRVGGGVLEDPREDDVVSFVSLGACVALGCAICLQGREGWRTVALLLAGVTGYSVVAGATMLLT